MDNHTLEQRRKNMKAIKCKNTKIEVMLRKELWARGVRYRKKCKEYFWYPGYCIHREKSCGILRQ